MLVVHVFSVCAICKRFSVFFLAAGIFRAPFLLLAASTMSSMDTGDDSHVVSAAQVRANGTRTLRRRDAQTQRHFRTAWRAVAAVTPTSRTHRRRIVRLLCVGV